MGSEALERSDEELFAAYVDSGDRAAFRELFARYSPLLTRVLARRVSSADDVSDMVQGAFLQLHRARLDFRRGGKLRPWLVTIAINVMRQHYRRAKSRPKEVEIAPDGYGSVGAQAPHDPVATDQARRLRAALAQLPESQRVAIELHWLEGLPFPEVAEVVGASVSAVKVRAHRGYARLRELLTAAGVTTTPTDAP